MSTDPHVSQRATPEELREFLSSWGPCAFLDFEFNHSSDPVLNLVCCSLQYVDAAGVVADPVEWWLHHDAESQADLREALEALRDQGTTLVGYGMAAECRSLLSLGIDPAGFRIVDLYSEWRQLTHNNHECEFGTYFTPTGFRRVSVPPSFDKRKNFGKDNRAVGMGLTAAVGQVFGIFLDSIHKNAMRDLILQDLPEYTQEQRAAIMAYCTSDVVYLPDLFRALCRRLHRAVRGQLTPAEQRRAQLFRGEYIVSIAKMEATGFPVNGDQIWNLRRNFASARDTIIQDLVDNYYPFYIREKKRASDLRGQWVEKGTQFEKFLRERGMLDSWPRTIDEETGKRTETLSKEDKVLADFDGIPEIHAYRQARKLIQQLRWFKEPTAEERKKDGDFFDTIGADGFQRAFLGPYGTQTSRNAPKASRFIPAMSSWLRCLIQPPPGWYIYSIDWASQEFGVAAILSGDRSMMAAYLSGDPYLYFAKKARAVPEDGTKEQYGAERDLFKSTTLGLQYGMGKDKLAAKLTADTGRKVSVEEAEKLIELHKRVYPDYWKWLDKISSWYERRKCLKLWDGWALLGDNDNFLSVRNLPTQGTGAVTMRQAVKRAHAAGLRIMSPLHDAIYGLARIGTEDDHPDILARCMDEAVREVLGDKLQIRQDRSIHAHGEPWVDKKGEKFYKLLARYLEPMETEEDAREKLFSTIFSEPVAK